MDTPHPRAGARPGSERQGVPEEADKIVRRMRVFGALSMAIIGGLTGSMAILLREWPAGVLGVVLVALFAACVGLAPLQKGRWARALAHLSLLGPTLGIPAVLVAIGSYPYAGVFLHALVILAAAHLIGVRAALGWTAASLAATAVTAWMVPMPEVVAAPLVLTITFRSTVLVSVMAYAIAVRWAEDVQTARLQLLARTDSLTGLKNRGELFERLGLAIEQTERFGRTGALLYVDLDGFKPINDELGHRAGDIVLEELAGRIAERTRSIDTSARLGGDEFAVLLSEVSEAKGEVVFAIELMWRLADTVSIHGRTLRVGASIGIATFPSEGGDAEEIVRRADEAMYVAKRSGGNGVWRWTPDGCQRVD